MALLGEMHFIPMTPDGWYHLPRSGGVSYAAQESWVQNETIKVSPTRALVHTIQLKQDNILFGASYDEERYKKGTLLSAAGLFVLFKFPVSHLPVRSGT
jgi:hypothetical protein